tara:strand:- start:118 stop:915 length:798 start_codon:yes stop_codon:yes gene_type:complete
MKKRKNKNTKKIILVLLIIIIVSLFILNKNKPVLKNIVKESEIEEKQQTLEVDKFTNLRENMVEQQLRNRDITDDKVLEVMNSLERHKFVPSVLVNNAYDDNPLPIGYGQTISQPYIVALMTQSLQVDENDKVLEIGTGSGYQAAVLAGLVKEIYTIEIIKELADEAENKLKNLNYKNAKVKNADGYFGWEEHAPYDAIIVTAAANHIPPSLLKQLKDNGKLIIPLGSTLTFQTLTLVTKKGNDLETEFITGVRFVPLTGKALEG